MLFWIREIIGWLFVVLALYMISMGIEHVTSTEIVEASVLVFAALGVMRLGLLLIRVSTAARICLREEQGASRNG